MNGMEVELTERYGATRADVIVDYDRLAEAAWRQARMFSFSSDERDQIAQEALARSWERRAQFDGRRGPVESWLFGIVRNVARELHREARRREGLWRRLQDRIDSPDAYERIALIETLEQLDTGDQELLYWRFWLGLSHIEVASRLGISPQASRQRLRRAIARLGRHLR